MALARWLIASNPAMPLAHAKRIVTAGLILLGIVALIGAMLIWDHFDDREVIARDRLEANAGALADQSQAETAAAAERARNLVTNFEQRGEFHDANNEPRAGDSVDPAVRLACKPLRNDGQDTAAIPECGGR